MRTLADTAKRDAKIALLGVTVGIWGVLNGVAWVGAPVVVLFLAQAILLWMRQKAGIYLTFLTSLLVTAWFGWQIYTKGFTMGRAALLGFMLFSFLAYWSSYRDILRGTASWDDPEDDDQRRRPKAKAEQTNGDEADGDKPMTSIVLLRRTPKPLDSKILLEYVRDAWDAQRKLGNEELFVVGESPVYILKSPQGIWTVHNHSTSYFDDKDTALKMPELRLRKAIEDHTAWLAVDLTSGFPGYLPADVYYPYIFRLIRELADDDTLAILRPETGHINIWSDEVAKSLGSMDPLEEFSTPVHSPVISVSDEDPRMKEAIEEARRTFNTFREHWATRGPEDSFLAKIPIRDEENSEIIWIEVTGLEPEFIHGTLANEPVNVEGHRLGDRMEVPVSDLYDWVIAKQGADGPLGLFTEKVVRAVQREARDAMGKADPDPNATTASS
jgi:uncharacterized protein YegJ (DUF2314 family)